MKKQMKKLIRFILLTSIIFSSVYGSMLFAQDSETINEEVIIQEEVVEVEETIDADESIEIYEDEIIEETIIEDNLEETNENINVEHDEIDNEDIELIDDNSLESEVIQEEVIVVSEDIVEPELVQEELVEGSLNEFNQLDEVKDLFDMEMASTLTDEDISYIINGHYSPFQRKMFRSFINEDSNENNTKVILNDFVLSNIYDGTPIWDENDDAGNDSGYFNKIVRSFDKIVYRTAYSTISEDLLSTVNNGTFYFKATLPISSTIASWDTKAMGWLENINIVTEENSSTIEGSVSISNQNVSPRVGTINWVVSVNDASNNVVIPTPVFEMSIDDTSLETYGEDIKVSAKTNMNAKLQYEGDYNSNPTFGLLLELIANKVGKGIKGQEIPDVNSNIKLTLEASPNQTINKFKNNTALDDGYIIRNLPYDNKEFKTDFNRIYNGGNINITQNNNELYLEISNYSFDSLLNKVTHNSFKNILDGQDYNDDHYPFGAYVITLNNPGESVEKLIYNLEIKSLEAYSREKELITDFVSSDNKDSYTRGIPQGGGPGMSGGPVSVMNVFIINPTTKERFNLIKKDADRNLPPDYKVYPGDLVQFAHTSLMYKNPTREYIETYWGLMKFDTDMFEVLNSNEEFSSPTSFEEPLLKEFYFVTKEDKTGWSNEEEMYNAHISQIKNENGYKLFETPEIAKESGYVVVGFLAKSVFENPSYVITYRGPVTYPAIKVKASSLINSDTQEMYLNNDPKRVGVVLGELEAIDFKGNIYKRENVYNSLGDDLDMYLHYQDIKLGLIKPSYDINGDLVTSSKSNAVGNRGGNYTHAPSLVGGTFYVQPYNTYVNKHVSQKINEVDEKEVFNLDTNQRQVFYDIEIGTSAPIRLNSLDNITVTETIPKSLSPINGSTDIEEKWGIVYDGEIKQDNTSNGNAGIIITNSAKKANETSSWLDLNTKNTSYTIEENKNEDGDTVVTWKFNNYPVSYKLPTIHYSAIINKDIDYGEKIVTTSTIKSDFVPKPNIDSVGVIPVRIGGATIEKNALPILRSKDDPIGFEIVFNNNSLLTDNSLSINSVSVDVLPYDDGNNVDLQEYKLNNISFEANLYDTNVSDDNIPILDFFYTLEDPSIVSKKTSSLIEVGLDNKILYNFTDTFWNKVEIELINNEGIYSISNTSLNLLIEEISNKKITAFGVRGNNLSSNSTYRFYYEYDWENVLQKEKHQKFDVVHNTVKLGVESEIFQETYDSAISFPSISKQIIKINDIEDNDLNNFPVRDNDVITYRINFSNNTSSISTINVYDSIPIGSSYVEGSASDNGFYNSDLNRLEWTFNDVGINDVGSVEFSVKVSKNDEIKEIINQGEVVINNESFYTDEVKNPKIIINGIKSSDPIDKSQVKLNEVITYYVTIINGGIIEANNIVVIDDIPKGTIFNSVDASGEYKDNKVIFNYPKLNIGEEITFSFSVKVNSYDTNPIINIATYGDNNNPIYKTTEIQHFIDKPIKKTDTPNNTITYQVVDTSNKISSNLYKMLLVGSLVLLGINKVKFKKKQ